MLIKLSRKSQAQTTAEYAILLGLVIGAAVAMQVYVKRGVQARIHEAGISLVNQTAELDTLAGQSAANGLQYEPYYQNSFYALNRTTNSTATLEKLGNYLANESGTTTRETGGYTRYGFNISADANQ